LDGLRELTQSEYTCRLRPVLEDAHVLCEFHGQDQVTMVEDIG